MFVFHLPLVSEQIWVKFYLKDITSFSLSLHGPVSLLSLDMYWLAPKRAGEVLVLIDCFWVPESFILKRGSKWEIPE